jgi:glutamate racemase
LTVLQEIIKQLPNEDVIYLADTARLPYGSRTPEEILKFNREIIPFLIKQGAKIIIMACGTSSAIAYPVVKDEYPIEMINLIEPGARAAVAATRNNRIGLLATIATVNSQAYQNKIHELKKEAEIFAVACPLFVPLIEGGFSDSDETKKVAKDYLRPLLQEQIDTLVLGCTHYPHLLKLLETLTGHHLTIVDPAEEAVADTKKLLKIAGTLKTAAAKPKYDYLVTGSPLQFEELGTRLFGRPITNVKQVTLA